jgi:hypothetical protein
VKRHSSIVFPVLVLTAALAALPLFDSAVSAQADFYKGKTIRIIVGSTPEVFITYGDACSRVIGASKLPVILK